MKLKNYETALEDIYQHDGIIDFCYGIYGKDGSYHGIKFTYKTWFNSKTETYELDEVDTVFMISEDLEEVNENTFVKSLGIDEEYASLMQDLERECYEYIQDESIETDPDHEKDAAYYANEEEMWHKYKGDFY